MCDHPFYCTHSFTINERDIMTKSELIRNTAYKMNANKCSNAEISDAIYDEHGWRPSNQLLISAIGPAKDRRLGSVDGLQMKQINTLCNTAFDGSYHDMKQAVIACKNYEIR